jgi:hypothetical protein
MNELMAFNFLFSLDYLLNYLLCYCLPLFYYLESFNSFELKAYLTYAFLHEYWFRYCLNESLNQTHNLLLFLAYWIIKSYFLNFMSNLIIKYLWTIRLSNWNVKLTLGFWIFLNELLGELFLLLTSVAITLVHFYLRLLELLLTPIGPLFRPIPEPLKTTY